MLFNSNNLCVIGYVRSFMTFIYETVVHLPDISIIFTFIYSFHSQWKQQAVQKINPEFFLSGFRFTAAQVVFTTAMITYIVRN